MQKRRHFSAADNRRLPSKKRRDPGSCHNLAARWRRLRSTLLKKPSLPSIPLFEHTIASMAGKRFKKFRLILKNWRLTQRAGWRYASHRVGKTAEGIFSGGEVKSQFPGISVTNKID